MPFKRFPDEDGEAQAFPVSFGPPASNGNASKLFNKAADADPKQADRLMPGPISSDIARRNVRNRSPSRTPAVAVRASSPSRIPPLINGTSSTSPPRLTSGAYGHAIKTEPSPQTATRHSTANMGRSSQSSQSLINDFREASSKFPAQDEIKKSIRAPGLMQLSPPTAMLNTQSIHSTSGMREPRVRHNSPHFASALQQLRSTEDGSAILPLPVEQQRDEMARGRRLRRFNDPIPRGSTVGSSAETQAAVDQVTNKRVRGESKPAAMETRNVMQDTLTEPEATDGITERDWQSTEPILGNCPDMCPESERLERERKGDLDKLERLDGDRNQTSRDLAVKKYTRTAEKHSSLIRPISVLMRTMKHLLHLLNREYDEELLNLHNFLWDRMRAVRMDLRMQHIFDQQAVLMHEQMIRFHILAMHELCQYAKGEGFSEGFDGHLNIEQMNKASVDLFHMYDDLHKAGHLCAFEAEFRGYYALLKLDKHPGYVVEPAELSLDLAKMTPEMRNTGEVQFARKVARACRSGNYLAFFRLARDATYLQACLMHAHFSKLRSQAMASLYSGLQRNQGIPIAQVEDWLGMEGEDIEALLLYHGFSIKNYEEPYMVKEGPFLNHNKPFQIRRSKLVEEKRSQIVEDDVLSSGQEKTSTGPVLERISSLRRQAELQLPAQLVLADEEMPDYEEDEQLQDTSHDHPGDFSWPLRDKTSQQREPEIQMPAAALLAPNAPTKKSMQGSPIVRKPEQDDYSEWPRIGKRRKSSSPPGKSSESGPIPDEHVTISRDKKLRTLQESSATARLDIPESVEVKVPFIDADHREEEIKRQVSQKAEADLVKVRILLRKWRALAAFKAEERQWRQQKLEAALSSFLMGLPVEDDTKVVFPKDTRGRSLPANAMELDLLRTKDERSEKIERMWSELDVIDVVYPILKQKNPTCKFLCWKLVMCTHACESAVRVQGRCDKSADWLLAKILHSGNTSSEGMFSTSSSQANVFFANQSSEARTPFFYISRELHFQHGEIQDSETGRGASGILFLVSETASLVAECRRLHALVNSLQNDAKLPLLVLYSSLPNSSSLDATALAKLLEMDELDKGKVACWTLLPILESYEPSCPSNVVRSFEIEGNCCSRSKGYYSEDSLKNGLSWLALKTPMQPNLRCVNIQNLVMEHLQPLFKILLAMEPAHVTPNMCVKAFNEALLKAANDVNGATIHCHFHWPPNELIKAFEKFTGEMMPSIPSPGWNEASYIISIIEALSLCQLPELPLAGVTVQNSWSNLTLRRQKAALESGLHTYMNLICGSKYADPLTLKAVDGIIQRSCSFKQTEMGRLVVPNWSLIFQQLYHVRLALLSGDPPAAVWVQIRTDSSKDLDTQMSSDSIDSIEYLGPTLDEMIELEHQEAALRRSLDAIHLSTEDIGLMGEELRRQTFLSTVAELEESRQENSEALQESLADSKATLDITEVIALPTEGELELERMVNEFCKRVDQQASQAANFGEDAVRILHEARHIADNFISPIAGNNIKKKTANVLAVFGVKDTGPYTDAGGIGLDSLTQLLQHCENIQNSIDEALGKLCGEQT